MSDYLENLTATTRALNLKTVKTQLKFKSPLMTKLLDNNRLIQGGLGVEEQIEVAHTDDLVQELALSSSQPGGSKDIYAKYISHVAHFMHPLERTGMEKLLNTPQGDGNILPLAKKMLAASQTGLRIRLYKRMMGCATDNELNSLETKFQGVFSALKPYTTYLNVARTSSAHNYWNPAGHADTVTSYNISKKYIRHWINQCERYSLEPGGIFVVLGTTLFEELQEDFEASIRDKSEENRAVQGFRTMKLDGYDIMEDPELDDLTINTVTHETDGTAAGLMGILSSGDPLGLGNLASESTGANVVLVLNINTWEWRYYNQTFVHEGKMYDDIFLITPFFDQSQIQDGAVKDLARIWHHANLVCTNPNQNMCKMNVH